MNKIIKFEISDIKETENHKYLINVEESQNLISTKFEDQKNENWPNSIKIAKKIYDVDLRTEINNLEGKTTENKPPRTTHAIFINIRSIWNTILKS